ncbi:MAG TPA: hypothetical protein VJ739_17190, partial [Gemmataceae bacterium]|nr:hypothetical protein [Gemmataceae bacterium]
KRLAVGLACGLVAYLVVAGLLRGQANDPTALPPLLVTLFSYAALTVGTVLGYAVGRAVFRQQAPPPAEPKEGIPAAVHGWEQVERRLAAWFSQHIRARPVSPAEECRALAERWKPRDTEP